MLATLGLARNRGGSWPHARANLYTLPPAPRGSPPIRRPAFGEDERPRRHCEPPDGQAEQEREPEDLYHADPTSHRGAQRSQATARRVPVKMPRQTSTALPTAHALQTSHSS